MKISAYLKDRLPAYLIGAAVWITVMIFLGAYRMPAEAAITVSVVLFLGAAAVILWDYIRKRSFYDKLLCDLERLDKKYLLSELESEPEFLEGHILYEVMTQMTRSMCEQVAVHRHEASDFREYIELWVHEIKLPVAGMQLMCHNSGDHRYDENLGRIDQYIESVLYYARSGSAEKDYIIKPVSLKRAFSEIAVKNRTELQSRSISLTTDGLGTEVMTDGKWLVFILGQLMGNSIKYNASEISVTAEESPDRTVLHFRDNGIGIPANDLPNIFEKSFTGENGRTHTASTGMGLYIVKKLCDKLGHRVTADSVQGEYTDIIITFGKNDMHDVF